MAGLCPPVGVGAAGWRGAGGGAPCGAAAGPPGGRGIPQLVGEARGEPGFVQGVENGRGQALQEVGDASGREGTCGGSPVQPKGSLGLELPPFIVQSCY